MNAAAGASVRCATALLEGLVAAGLRDLVLCPGSRSAPLAYAAWRLEQAGRIRLHVRHDERAAAFLALGMGLGDPTRPAAVITTSGTAVANLHPAVLEASHAGVPLIAVSADRPSRLRGTWANQTSHLQSVVFGAAPRLTLDVAAPATGDDDECAAWTRVATDAWTAARGLSGGRTGPVHLNLAFDNPLTPGEVSSDPGEVSSRASESTDSSVVREHDGGPETVLGGEVPTVVVAGDGAGPIAGRIASEAGWPMLAEPSARAGHPGIPGYRLLLAAGFGADVRRVVVVGHPTLSRPVAGLLADPTVDLVHVVRHVDEPGPERSYQQVLADRVRVERGAGDPAWLRRWTEAGITVARVLDEVIDRFPGTGLHAMRDAVANVRSREVVVVAASNPVRDLDLLSHSLPQDVPVFANRGLAGIDGTLGTSTGVALATGARVRVLIGDLAFLHDAGSLVVPASEQGRAQVQVQVFNDDGGGIFATLEHGTRPDSFERIFGTPHGRDLAALGEALAPGAVTQLTTSRGQLRELNDALTDAVAAALDVAVRDVDSCVSQEAAEEAESASE